MRVFRAVFSVVSYCATIPESDTIRKVLHEDDWTFLYDEPIQAYGTSRPRRLYDVFACRGGTGVDAVYLGCDAFNARRSADNFTLDDLARACDFAHLRGVRVYLTLNIAIMPDEISAALELARQA